MTTLDKQAAQASKAWPFVEAQAVLKRLMATNKGQIKTPDKGYVLFETGYGPSGLPHIGTFGENCRTSMVLQAFRALAPEIPAKMICFSDDMDGLRKVPDNVPNPDIIRPYVETKDTEGNIIGDPTPLTSVPNPFPSPYESFGAHNNTRLQEFLDQFGFEYEFISSTDIYKTGRLNDGLRKILQNWDAICATVATILGEDRQQTYAPLFPIVGPDPEWNPERKIILHNIKLIEILDLDAGTARFEILRGPHAGKIFDHCVLDGGAKAQWRADWALRWYALDVDYEMSGSDLKSAADIAGKILQIMGGRRPAGFHYDLFLDEDGKKISKSKGNGLTMEDWLTYAPHESLAYYMYQRPTSGKKLYFDIIPKAMDEYIEAVKSLPAQSGKDLADNPAWYIHRGTLPNDQFSPLSFSLLLNLVNAANTDKPGVLWGFIRKYYPDASPENSPLVDRMVGYALTYYRDFILPAKSYRMADAREEAALKALAEKLDALPPGQEPETYMTEVFSAGKENGYEKDELRLWFQSIYQILLGQDQGPRFGSFIALYGPKETAQMIRDALAGKFAKAA